MRARGGSDIRDVNLNSENWAVVKAALVAGMYPNIMNINHETTLPLSCRAKKVCFHPTSVLNQSQFKEVQKNKNEVLSLKFCLQTELACSEWLRHL